MGSAKKKRAFFSSQGILALWACWALSALALPRSAGERWEGGFGAQRASVRLHASCPISYQSMCSYQDNTIPQIHMDVGKPGNTKVICLGTAFDASTAPASLYPANRVTLFDDPARNSARYESRSQTDLFILDGVHMRLPVAYGSRANYDSFRCEGVLPLGPRSPLWNFWRNATVDAHQMVVGGVPRVLGQQQGFPSVPLPCLESSEAMCATPATILNQTYVVNFWSGSRFTMIPPRLRADIEQALLRGDTHLVLHLPGRSLLPTPAQCRAVRRAMGLDDDSPCAHPRPLTLRLPLDRIVQASNDRYAATPLLLAAPDDEQVYITADVLRDARFFVDPLARHMVVAPLAHNVSITTGWLVALAFIGVVYLRHQTLHTPTLWGLQTAEARPKVPLEVLFSLLWEMPAVGVALAVYGAADTQEALRYAGGWVVPLLATVQGFYGAVTVLVALASAATIVRMRVRFSLGAVMPRPRSTAALIHSERAFLIYSHALCVTLLLGALLIVAQRTPGDTGSVWMLLAALLLFNQLLGSFGRAATLEALAYYDWKDRRRGDDLRKVGGARRAYLGEKVAGSKAFLGLWVAFIGINTLSVYGLSAFLAAFVWTPFLSQAVATTHEAQAILGVLLALFMIFNSFFYLGVYRAVLHERYRAVINPDHRKSE